MVKWDEVMHLSKVGLCLHPTSVKLSDNPTELKVTHTHSSNIEGASSFSAGRQNTSKYRKNIFVDSMTHILQTQHNQAEQRTAEQMTISVDVSRGQEKIMDMLDTKRF